MYLVHRTNYWGKYIESNDNDFEVDFDAIWVQAMNDGDGHCCRGFGNRSVAVYNSDFQEEFNGSWSLFKVSEQRGTQNSMHYFYKFVAIPQGEYGYGKRGCQQRGWLYHGTFHATQALERLEYLLGGYLVDDKDINHVHIGLWMDTLYAP